MFRVNRAGREKLNKILAYKLGISYSSILRILYKEGITNIKPAIKPSLIIIIDIIRLK
jgi:hypothetical protein